MLFAVLLSYSDRPCCCPSSGFALLLEDIEVQLRPELQPHLTLWASWRSSFVLAEACCSRIFISDCFPVDNGQEPLVCLSLFLRPTSIFAAFAEPLERNRVQQTQCRRRKGARHSTRLTRSSTGSEWRPESRSQERLRQFSAGSASLLAARRKWDKSASRRPQRSTSSYLFG